MSLFRNRFFVFACIISFVVQAVAPSLVISEENPDERTASVFVGKYDVVKDSHSVPFLDHLAGNGIPAIYGEIIEASAKAAGQTFTNEAWKGGEIAKQLAMRKFITERLSWISGHIGNFTAALDAGGKLYSGQYDEAALSVSLTALSKYAGTEAGAASLKAIGITSTAYVTAVIIAVQVWNESRKALAAETRSRELESLYGSIEIMIRDKSRRTLGEGDPFPPSAENIAKIWQRVLNDSSFRSLFRVYVTDQLEKDFPEPGFFDTVDTYLAAPWSEVTAEDALEDQSKSAMIKEYSTLKSYIAGLVSWLNRAAKVSEQHTIARQELQKLVDRIKQASGGNMEQAIQKMENALTMLGVVEAYLKDCMERIEKAEKEKDCEALQVHMKMISDYVKDVIAWIPARGPFADQRNAAFTKLKEAYAKAEDALKKLIGEIQEKLETPKPPETDESVSEDLPQIDVVDMFKSKFGEILKPFDWGGEGDVSGIKENYLKILEAGQFRHPLDTKNSPLPDGREPVAEEIETAWSVENYQGAANTGGGTPEKEDTIAGYKEYLLKKIAEVKTPDEIVSLSESLSAQSAEIQKIYNRGTNLFWGRTEDGEKITGETEEQAKARRAQGDALRDQANQMSAALKPSYERLQALKIAWDQAKQMAGEAAGNIILMARLTRDETTSWMTQTRAYIENELNPVYEQYHMLNARFKSFEDSYLKMKNAGLDASIENLRNTVSDNSYVGLQGTKIPESASLFSGAYSGISRLTSNIYTGEEKLNSASMEIQNNLQTVDSMEYLGKEWNEFLSDASAVSAAINASIDPSFLADARYSNMQALFGEMDKTSTKYREALSGIAKDCMEYIENRQKDAAWLQRANNNLLKFTKIAYAAGVLGDADSLTTGIYTRTNMVDGDKATISKPYYHYFKASERDAIVNSLKSHISSTRLDTFLTGVAPWLDRAIKDYLQKLSSLSVVQEDNFFIGSIPSGEKVPVVLKSNLDEAAGIAGTLVPGNSDWDEKFSRIRQLIPMGFDYRTQRESLFPDLKVPENAPLAKEFLSLRENLIALYYKNNEVAEQKRKDAFTNAANLAISRWDSLAGPLKERINKGDEFIKKANDPIGMDKAALQDLRNRIIILRDTLQSDPYREYSDALYNLSVADMLKNQYSQDSRFIHSGMQRLPGELYNALSLVDSRLSNFDDGKEAVKLFYESFKSAYEEKNDAGLMNCLSDEWEAGDGTSLYDVEDHFRNMFTVFDDIRLNITNMQIQKLGSSKYRVSYTLLITGRIFSDNITHEEKSSVVEEVTISDSKRVRITRTPEGRFWYVN